MGWFLQGETLVTVRDGRPTGSSVVPLGRGGHIAVAGDAFYYGDGIALRVDRDGLRAKRLVATIPSEPLSAADRRAIIEEYLAGQKMPPMVLEQYRRGFAALLTRAAPAFDTLFADPRGRAWVRLTKRPSESHTRWVVLSPGGEEVRRIRMPARLTVLEIGVAHLLATADDDSGRPLLMEFPLRLPD
jgi:hypothetical protein